MRLIDGDKLLEVIAEQERWNVPDFVYESIKNAPTIDAEPVKCGKWEDNKVAFYLKCSECGATVRKNLYDVFLDCDIRDLNYCPHCGARMEGAEE